MANHKIDVLDWDLVTLPSVKPVRCYAPMQRGVVKARSTTIIGTHVDYDDPAGTPVLTTGLLIEDRGPWDYSWVGDLFNGTDSGVLDGGVTLAASAGGPTLNQSTGSLATSAIGGDRVNKAAFANSTDGYYVSQGSSTIPALASGLTDLTIRGILYVPASVSVESTLIHVFMGAGQFMRVNVNTSSELEIEWRAGGMSGPITQTITTDINTDDFNLLDLAFDADIGSSQAQLGVWFNGTDKSPAAVSQGATGWSINAGIGILEGTSGSAPADDGGVLFYGIKKAASGTISLAQHQSDHTASGL